MSNLPQVVTDDGELIRLVTAEHLLEAAGITDPREAETEQLAEFTDNADHLTAIAREAKGTVSAELVRRLDRRGKWTLREAGFKITAPSPEAGTTRYDDEQLAAAVNRLIEEDLIDADAGLAAIEWYQPPPPEPYWKQKPAGIKALLKLGGAVAKAVEACKVSVDPPKRTAKVKRESA